MIRNIFNELIQSIKNNKIERKTNSKIYRSASIDLETTLEGRNEIYGNTKLRKCNIGYATYISFKCEFLNSNIGRYCSIASNVQLVVGNHPTKDFVSTHPIFYAKREIGGLNFGIDESFHEVSILPGTDDRYLKVGNDVWIGTNVLIINGITIGDGAIIAAGSVVTKDVPAYAIVGGVPAKLIRYRFDEDDIKFLEKLQWWNKEDKWIISMASYFNDIKKLRIHIGENFEGKDGEKYDVEHQRVL